MDPFLSFISDSSNFTFQNGIWYANNQLQLSYPKEGHESCFAIEEESFWFNHRNTILINAIQRHSPKSVIFDIGGGNGYVSKGLEEKGIGTVLVEPGVAGAQNAAKRGLKNIICASTNDLKSFVGKIEAIGTFDVVEHINDDQRFIKELHELLIEKGFLYISVPAFMHLWSNEDDEAGHYRRYTLKQIASLLEKNGFTVCYKTYFFSFLWLPLMIFRSIPSKLGIRRKSEQQTQNEHKAKSKVVQTILNTLKQFEKNKISKLKTLPFGTSCLIVAQKK